MQCSKVQIGRRLLPADEAKVSFHVFMDHAGDVVACLRAQDFDCSSCCDLHCPAGHNQAVFKMISMRALERPGGEVFLCCMATKTNSCGVFCLY